MNIGFKHLLLIPLSCLPHGLYPSSIGWLAGWPAGRLTVLGNLKIFQQFCKTFLICFCFCFYIKLHYCGKVAKRIPLSNLNLTRFKAFLYTYFTPKAISCSLTALVGCRQLFWPSNQTQQKLFVKQNYLLSYQRLNEEGSLSQHSLFQNRNPYPVCFYNYIHILIIGHYNSLVGIAAWLLLPLILCAVNLYVSGWTCSLTLTPNDRFLRNFFMEYLFTLRVFARNLLGANGLRNIFFHISWYSTSALRLISHNNSPVHQFAYDHYFQDLILVFALLLDFNL